MGDPVAVEFLPAESRPRPTALLPTAPEDTTYIWYVVAALFVELVGAPVIGVLMFLARTGRLSSNLPGLVAAHGSLQLLGWAGLFVAGMAQRLVPRLSGRPAPTAAAMPLLLLLAGGAILRAGGQAAGNAVGRSIGAAGALAAACGIMGVALVLAASLARRRSPMAGWVVLAWTGCGWWGVWALLEVWGGWLGFTDRGLVPHWFDQPKIMLVMLGAIGSFIWAVQSRMVPIFFGRRQPTAVAVAVPAVMYNLGLLAILVTLSVTGLHGGVAPAVPAMSVGLGLVGGGMIWFAAGTGALTGIPHRLRAASQPLARYVVSANRWAVLAGALWITASVTAVLLTSAPGHNLSDAALHAFGTGVITILIAGMVQMVAPVFARARIEGGPRPWLDRSVWPLLWAATATRVIAALTAGYFRGDAFTLLAAVSGILGWAGIGTLAWLLVIASSGNSAGVPRPRAGVEP